jgi:hypothetical protein
MPYSITREDPERDLRALRAVLSGFPVSISSSAIPALQELADSIEEQVIPPEPSGDVVVFFTLGHPRAGVAYCPDGGLWDGDSEAGLTWAEIAGKGKAEEVMLYRRVEYPEVDIYGSDSYKTGCVDTIDRLQKHLIQLRSSAITAERQDAYDKAIEAVEALS